MHEPPAHDSVLLKPPIQRLTRHDVLTAVAVTSSRNVFSFQGVNKAPLSMKIYM
jgi:hypothetical protein